jgi:hypothetical protein
MGWIASRDLTLRLEGAQRLRLFRGTAKYEVGENVEHQDQHQHGQHEGATVGFQVDEGGVAVAHGENSLAAVAQSAAQENGEDESARGDLENSFGQDEGLERKRRGEERGKKRAEEAVVIHPLFDFFRFAACVLVKESFAAFFRQEIQNHGTQQRTECGHGGVIGHARVIGDTEFDENCVGKEWKGKHRGIEEGDDEQAASAEGHDQALEPHEYFSTAHVC